MLLSGMCKSHASRLLQHSACVIAMINGFNESVICFNSFHFDNDMDVVEQWEFFWATVVCKIRFGGADLPTLATRVTGRITSYPRFSGVCSRTLG